MRTLKIAIATLFLLVLAGTASAADWMTEDGGSVVCAAIRPGGICWLSGITEDSSAIVLQDCATLTIMVYGTAASIMPRTCTDTACGTAEPLLAAVLDGDATDTFMMSSGPLKIVDIDWTAGGAAPTVSIMCGR